MISSNRDGCPCYRLLHKPGFSGCRQEPHRRSGMLPSLTEAQLAHWNTRGYLVLDDVLDVQRDIAPVVAEYEALLDTLCSRWYDEGSLSSTYADLPFGQ